MVSPSSAGIKNEMMVLWILLASDLLSFMEINVSGMTSVNPADVFARRGDGVRINCSTNAASPVGWYRETDSDWPGETIYSNGVVATHFKKQFEVVNENPGRYDLIIKQIQLKDGGSYQCRDDGGEWDHCWGSGCSLEALVSVYETSKIEIPCDEQQTTCSIESPSISCLRGRNPDSQLPPHQISNWFAYTGGCCGCGSPRCCDALVVLNFTTECFDTFPTGDLVRFTDQPTTTFIAPSDVTECLCDETTVTITVSTSPMKALLLGVACLFLIGVIAVQCVYLVRMTKTANKHEKTPTPPNEYDEIPTTSRDQQQSIDTASSLEGDVVRLNRGIPMSHYVNTPSEVDSVEYAEGSIVAMAVGSGVRPGAVSPPYANLRSRKEETRSTPIGVEYDNVPARKN